MPQDPFIKCFCLFTCTYGLIEGRIIFVVVDLLSLKLLIFRLIISERSECTILHLFFENFAGEHAPRPPSTSVIPHPYRATCALSLVDSLIFIKTLKDADQIVKRLCTVTKIKYIYIYILYFLQVQESIHTTYSFKLQRKYNSNKQKN